MDILPFINKNGLWYLDIYEELQSTLSSSKHLFIAEIRFVELLDELSGNIFQNLNLEFHYDSINPYDAKLVKEGTRYKCVFVLGKHPDTLIWFPSHIYKAMESNRNPEKIFIRVIPMV